MTGLTYNLFLSSFLTADEKPQTHEYFWGIHSSILETRIDLEHNTSLCNETSGLVTASTSYDIRDKLIDILATKIGK